MQLGYLGTVDDQAKYLKLTYKALGGISLLRSGFWSKGRAMISLIELRSTPAVPQPRPQGARWPVDPGAPNRPDFDKR
jgi:hypothetical protein